MMFLLYAPFISAGIYILVIIIAAICRGDNSSYKRSEILEGARKIQNKEAARPYFIKEVGTYIAQFPIGHEINYSELNEKFRNYNQDLPDIFELNDFLHTINCEVDFFKDHYFIVPIGTIDFEAKREKLKKKSSSLHN